jgi:UDP-N-acetyl-D-mannosaminuronate dehydrogenase
MEKKNCRYRIGYGLPLARLFATKSLVVDFDINEPRVNELNNGQ